MNAYKRIGSFALVLVLIFMVFANPVLTPPAHANPVVIGVGVIAILVTLCGLIGITFATVDAAKEASEMIVAVHPDILMWAHKNQLPPEGGDPNKPGGFLLDLAATGALITILDKIKALFPAEGEGTFSAPSGVDYIYSDVTFTEQIFTNSEQAYNAAPYGGSLITDIGDVNYTYETIMTDYGNVIEWGLFVNQLPVRYNYNGSQYDALRTANADNNYLGRGSMYKFKSFVGIRFGFYRNLSYPNELKPFIAWSWIDKNDKQQYGHIQPQGAVSVGALPLVETEVSPIEIDYPYEGETKYPLRDATGALIDLVVGNGTVTVPTIDIETAIETNTDEDMKKKQDYFIDLIPGLRDLLDKPGTTDPEPTPEPDEDLDPPRLDGNGLFDRFPFCVPKDLYLLVSALNAPAKNPVFEIPVVIPVANYEGAIVLDLTKYGGLTKTVRIGVTFFFLLGLIMASRKLIRG